MLLRNVLVHDGLTKNPIGVAGLDLYPKQFTTNDHLQDQPFQADYFTRLYDQLGDLATGPQAFAYAAELQGGFYAYPLLGHPKVAPEATDQLLARTIGRGLKGGSFYVIRDGHNLDGSAYDYLAAIAADGGLTPRYQVMQRWGKLLANEGPTLLQASEQVDDIAVLTNGRHAAPQGGLLDDLQRLVTIEDPALFGWLVHAGFNPAVLDARVTTLATLAIKTPTSSTTRPRPCWPTMSPRAACWSSCCGPASAATTSSRARPATSCRSSCSRPCPPAPGCGRTRRARARSM